MESRGMSIIAAEDVTSLTHRMSASFTGHQRRQVIVLTKGQPPKAIACSPNLLLLSQEVKEIRA